MASYSKIWCTFIPHMCLKSKFHDTIFIIKLCARKGGRGGRNQNITASEILLKGTELCTLRETYFDITCSVFITTLSVYSPHYRNTSISSRLKVTYKL